MLAVALFCCLAFTAQRAVASSLALYSDSNCTRSNVLENVAALDGYPDGECTHISDLNGGSDSYSSLMFLTLDAGCASKLFLLPYSPKCKSETALTPIKTSASYSHLVRRRLCRLLWLCVSRLSQRLLQHFLDILQRRRLHRTIHLLFLLFSKQRRDSRHSDRRHRRSSRCRRGRSILPGATAAAAGQRGSRCKDEATGAD